MQSWTHKCSPHKLLVTHTRILAQTELTYNYYPHTPPLLKIPCRCGASNCSGWMGQPIRKPRPSPALRPTTQQSQTHTIDRHITQTLAHNNITHSDPHLEPPDLDERTRLTDTTLHKWLTKWSLTRNIHYNDNSSPKPDTEHWISSSFLYEKLTEHGFNPAAVARWSRKQVLDLQNIRYIHIPVHIKSPEHWILITIDTQRHTISNYDSLGIRRPDILSNLLKWWEDVHTRHLNTTLNTAKWTKRNPRITLQTNAIDCGLHVILNIAMLTSTGTITPTTHTFKTIRTWITLTIDGHTTLDNPDLPSNSQSTTQLEPDTTPNRTQERAKRKPSHTLDTRDTHTQHRKKQLTEQPQRPRFVLPTINTHQLCTTQTHTYPTLKLTHINTHTAHITPDTTLDHDIDQILSDITRHQTHTYPPPRAFHIDECIDIVRKAANAGRTTLTPDTDNRLEQAPIEIQILLRTHTSWVPRPALHNPPTFRADPSSLLAALTQLTNTTHTNNTNNNPMFVGTPNDNPVPTPNNRHQDHLM